MNRNEMVRDEIPDSSVVTSSIYVGDCDILHSSDFLF